MDTPQVYTNNKSRRNERLEARISSELKTILQYAADLQGSSLSEFLIRSARESANEVIREHQVIKFSTLDSRAFAESLFNPKKPNKKLKSAYLNYKKEVIVSQSR